MCIANAEPLPSVDYIGQILASAFLEFMVF